MVSASKALLIAALIGAISIQVKASQTQPVAPNDGLDIGLSLALPAVGLSFRKVLSESRTVALTLGNGAQIQINFTGSSHLGGYYLLGIGSDDVIGLVRMGYGYTWQPNQFSFHLEAALHLPFWDRDLDGLANISKVAYLFPVGIGMHYNFLITSLVLNHKRPLDPA